MSEWELRKIDPATGVGEGSTDARQGGPGAGLRDDSSKVDGIVRLWREHIDPSVSRMDLENVVRNLEKEMSIDYIRFAIDYCISHSDKIRLRYPNGLKYVTGYGEIRKAYGRLRARRFDDSMFHATKGFDDDPKIEYKPEKRGFMRILMDCEEALDE